MTAAARRPQRRVLEGAAVAAVLSGTPSLLSALVRGGPGAAVGEGLAATRAIATLLPPRRPALARGVVIHLGISLAVGEGLAAALPRERSVLWGAVAGLGVGTVALGVAAPRWFPALAALPLAPQLADNAAFGALLAAVADR